jgi:hypothetical protein
MVTLHLIIKLLGQVLVAGRNKNMSFLDELTDSLQNITDTDSKIKFYDDLRLQSTKKIMSYIEDVDSIELDCDGSNAGYYSSIIYLNDHNQLYRKTTDGDEYDKKILNKSNLYRILRNSFYAHALLKNGKQICVQTGEIPKWWNKYYDEEGNVIEEEYK